MPKRMVSFLPYILVMLGLVGIFLAGGFMGGALPGYLLLYFLPVVGSAASHSLFFVTFTVAVAGFFASVAWGRISFLLWGSLALVGWLSLFLVKRECLLAKAGWEEYKLLADQHVAAQDHFESYSARLIKKNQELESRLNELNTLYGLTTVVGSTTDLKRIYTDISDAVAKICGFDCFIFFEADPGEKCLVVKEASGVFSPWRKGDKLFFHQGIIGRHASWGQVALIEDVKTQTAARATAEEEWFKSLMVIPVAVDGQLLAVLALARAEDPAFTRNELYIVQSLACQVGTAIHRAWLYKRLEALAVTDGLTGLANRRHMEEILRREFARAERYQLVLSVVLLDVDHFKQYNDNNGHQAGDKLLQRISGVLKECIREVDIAARYGGEEFLLILPETGRGDAFAVAERIREKVNTLSAPGAEKQPLGCLSVSCGVASYPQDARGPEQLVKCADTALYQAKARGRNHVVLFASPEDR
ncbi:MAG: diguanylate cyclase [Firmicutes bacterium]|nr:diguanylate cyclase [Bacillota bacterium]